MSDPRFRHGNVAPPPAPMAGSDLRGRQEGQRAAPTPVPSLYAQFLPKATPETNPTSTGIDLRLPASTGGAPSQYAADLPVSVHQVQQGPGDQQFANGLSAIATLTNSLDQSALSNVLAALMQSSAISTSAPNAVAQNVVAASVPVAMAHTAPPASTPATPSTSQDLQITQILLRLVQLTEPLAGRMEQVERAVVNMSRRIADLEQSFTQLEQSLSVVGDRATGAAHHQETGISSSSKRQRQDTGRAGGAGEGSDKRRRIEDKRNPTPAHQSTACWNCGESDGHQSKQCPLGRQVCANCNETGHIIDFCWKPKRENAALHQPPPSRASAIDALFHQHVGRPLQNEPVRKVALLSPMGGSRNPFAQGHSHGHGHGQGQGRGADSDEEGMVV